MVGITNTALREERENGFDGVDVVIEVTPKSLDQLLAVDAELDKA